jgi:hypothetical protein
MRREAGGMMSPTKETSKMMNRTGFAYTRALSRQFFPTWSRRARARWVLARMKAKNPRVPISSSWSHDSRAYWFQRTTRA